MRHRCQFCHEYVSAADFPAHVARHTQRRSDGQQTEHITLPPDERAPGDLSGIPHVYIHAQCGKQTGMPEEIIRSYLANPFLYSDRTFCVGCKTYVPHATVKWVETGQFLSDYFDELKRKAIREGHGPKLGRPNWLSQAIAALFGAIFRKG